MVESDPGDSYRRAGLTEAETEAVAAVAAEVGSADPLAAYVAVPLPAVAAVLQALDRLVDAAPARHTLRAGRRGRRGG